MGGNWGATFFIGGAAAPWPPVEPPLVIVDLRQAFSQKLPSAESPLSTISRLAGLLAVKLVE